MLLTNCPNCGAPYEHGLDHCQYCGTPYPITQKQEPKPIPTTPKPNVKLYVRQTVVEEYQLVSDSAYFMPGEDEEGEAIDVTTFGSTTRTYLKGVNKPNKWNAFMLYDYATFNMLCALNGKECQFAIDIDGERKEIVGTPVTYVKFIELSPEKEIIVKITETVSADNHKEVDAVPDAPPIHPQLAFIHGGMFMDPNTHLVRSAEREAGLKQIGIRLQELQAQADTDRKAFEEEQKAKRERDKKFDSWRMKENIQSFCFISCLVSAVIAIISFVVSTAMFNIGIHNSAEQIFNIGFRLGLVGIIASVIMVGVSECVLDAKLHDSSL